VATPGQSFYLVSPDERASGGTHRIHVIRELPVVRPLSGIKVCDLTQNLAGPFCTQILGDLGAEVLKIEPPGGDSARPWGPPFWGPDSTLFLSANRNKRSIILDLKRPEGREVLHRIAAECDVFAQSARIGVPERLAYDYDSIRALRADVVYMSITAYGDRGPLSTQPGYDPLMQAFSGIMSLTGHPGEAPARVGGSVVDFGTGMWSAIAILAALRQRDATGVGARLDSSLLDTSLNWVSYHIMGYLSTGETPGPMGSGLVSIVPYQAFTTADGQVMIAAGNDGIFRRLCAALELPDLAIDPRFASNPARVQHRADLISVLERAIAPLSTDGLLELMQRFSVPCSPIQTIDEVTLDPQVQASGMIVDAPNPDAPGYRDISLPLRIDGERPRGELPPPRPGQHTREILEQAGYSDAEVRSLLGSGVVEA
jgi:crotonobetainyl-CoA:carnitine CoA-transferase CaiB-like acyl-CoA transferase